MTTLQKLPKNVCTLGKLILATGYEKLPKIQKIAQSGHTVSALCRTFSILTSVVVQLIIDVSLIDVEEVHARNKSIDTEMQEKSFKKAKQD